jgi:NAD(P) transhydrogenase
LSGIAKAARMQHDHRFGRMSMIRRADGREARQGSGDAMDSFDLVVIGSGPAGRRAAVQAAKLGKSVLVVEGRKRVGGVSVHTGTIPSKTLRETVLNLTGWRERGFYGRSYRVKKDIGGGDLDHRIDQTLAHEVDVLEHQFQRNGVRTMEGFARFVDPHVVCVTAPDESELMVSGERFLIAVGTAPFRPDYIPFDDDIVLDSDVLIENPRVPRSLVVIGAGVIGIEYATIFSALDVQVTLIEPRDTFLDFIDREIIEEFVHQLRDRNMIIRLGARVTSIGKDAGGHVVTTLEDGRSIRSEMLLFAAGRVGATAQLGLEACGLGVDNRGRLKVDPKTFQTDVPHIYAAGDVIGFPSLASTSMEQGRIAACHAFGLPMPPAPAYFPYGIYAVPEISTVGMSEQEVKEKKIPYECGIARFRETSRGHIMGLDSGMMKMIFSIRTRRLLGVHIIGEGATELIHIGQAVLNLKGTIDYFIENTFNYPTLAEAYKIAALDAWNRMPLAQ